MFEKVSFRPQGDTLRNNYFFKYIKFFSSFEASNQSETPVNMLVTPRLIINKAGFTVNFYPAPCT